MIGHGTFRTLPPGDEVDTPEELRAYHRDMSDAVALAEHAQPDLSEVD